VEEHSVSGGLGGCVAEIVSQNNPVPMRILGIPDENTVIGSSAPVFKYYGIDSDGIFAAACEMCK